MSANRHATRYFGQHYGVKWVDEYKSIYTSSGVLIKKYTIEDYYPRKKK